MRDGPGSLGVKWLNIWVNKGWASKECPIQSESKTQTNMGCSPPGSSVHGILQARILEWVAISFSKYIIWPSLKDLQFSLVTQSCLTLCNPMACSTPGLPVHHQLPEFTQTHVHWVSDAIQPSHPLSSPSPPAFSLSQSFKWVSSSHQVAKVLEFQF